MTKQVSRLSLEIAAEVRLTQVSKEAAENTGSIQLYRCNLSNCLNLQIVVKQFLLNAPVFRQNHHYSNIAQSTGIKYQAHLSAYKLRFLFIPYCIIHDLKFSPFVHSLIPAKFFAYKTLSRFMLTGVVFWICPRLGQDPNRMFGNN